MSPISPVCTQRTARLNRSSPASTRIPPLRSSSSSSSSRTSIGGDCTECAIAGQPLRTLCLARRVGHVEDGDLATHLKTATRQPLASDSKIADVVSRILLDVEREGEAAVRRYSERFDGWLPERFTVRRAELERL